MVGSDNWGDNNDRAGFGWNISAAVDLGKGNHGFLLGLQYLGGKTQFSGQYWSPTGGTEYPINASAVTTSFGIFVKYAYRKKLP